MRKKNNCSKCNKEIVSRAKKCHSCSAIKHGKTLITGFCKDCGKKLNKHSFFYGTIRCRSCSMKQKYKLGYKNPNLKHGKSTKIYFCINCNKRISDYRVNKCRSCSAKQYSKQYWFIGQKGSNNPAWKGGISELTNLIRHFTKYNEWRTICFKRDNYICQHCKQIGGRLEVDHIKPFAQILNEFLSKYNQFSLIEDKWTLVRISESYAPFWEVSNGRTLCKSCHKKTATYGNRKGKV